MAVRRVTGTLVLIAAAGWSGCTAETSQPSLAPSARPSPSAVSEAPDPLASAPPTAPYGTRVVSDVLRAGDGTTIIVFEPMWPRERTSYRLYDRRWRPLTRLLRVAVSLEVRRATPDGFVGHAMLSRQDGSTKLDEWVTIDGHGRVEPVSEGPSDAAARRMRTGDLYLQRGLSYRPATNAVVRQQRPAWDGRRFVWYAAGEGQICAVRAAPLADLPVVHVSHDEGHSFSTIAPARLLPAGVGPRIQSCLTTEERTVVMTGGEYPRWLHTLDQTGRRVLSRQPLGDELDPYQWYLLPDGRLVTATKRPGYMVATDNTNRLMEFRPATSGNLFLLGDEMVVVDDDSARVSEDAGRSWHPHGLRLP